MNSNKSDRNPTKSLASGKQINLLVKVRDSQRQKNRTKNITVSPTSTLDGLKALLNADIHTQEGLKIWHQGKLLNNGSMKLRDAGLTQFSKLVAECAAPLEGGMA